MRFSMLICLVFGLGASIAAAAESRDQQWKLCASQSVAWDVTIGACTARIQSRQETIRNLAIAYANRGLAYQAKGDNDRAIADSTEAIRLDRKYAPAYANRGNAYRAKGDNDRAIAEYSEAIRLDPKYAVAYNNRGNAYRDKGDNDRALADYSQAIRVDPNYALAYYNRGNAYGTKGDSDRAIADYSEAIRLDPKDALGYGNRGRLYFYQGRIAGALADFNQASEIDPADAYAALWLDIAGQRSAIPSRLPRAIAKLDMTKWPAPVIRMFLGQLPVGAVLAAADDQDVSKKMGQVCEANFYGGEFVLRQGKKAEAIGLLRLAVRDCPRGFLEWDAARAALKALGEAL